MQAPVWLKIIYKYRDKTKKNRCCPGFTQSMPDFVNQVNEGKVTIANMKTVILFRHGKSDWGADFSKDHERPVAKRGIKAARSMGKWLTGINQVPDHLVTSSALRAKTTLELASEAGAWGKTPIVTDALYDATVSAYVEVIRQTPAQASSVLIAGHEPTCSLTTAYLVGGARNEFPTATMARIDLDVDDWSEVDASTGTLIWFVPPRYLAG